MKKIIFIVLLSLFLCGCGSESMVVDCEVITMRPYSTVTEKGLFTTKVSSIDYIEYTYEYNGEIRLDTVRTSYLKIGDKTKVSVEVLENDYIFDTLYLSLEDYKNLYGLEE